MVPSCSKVLKTYYAMTNIIIIYTYSGPYVLPQKSALILLSLNCLMVEEVMASVYQHLTDGPTLIGWSCPIHPAKLTCYLLVGMNHQHAFPKPLHPRFHAFTGYQMVNHRPCILILCSISCFSCCLSCEAMAFCLQAFPYNCCNSKPSHIFLSSIIRH